jgi:hypothetical protein
LGATEKVSFDEHPPFVTLVQVCQLSEMGVILMQPNLSEEKTSPNSFDEFLAGNLGGKTETLIMTIFATPSELFAVQNAVIDCIALLQSYYPYLTQEGLAEMRLLERFRSRLHCSIGPSPQMISEHAKNE